MRRVPTLLLAIGVLLAPGCAKRYPADRGTNKGAGTMTPAPRRPSTPRSRRPAEPRLASRVVLFMATWCPICHQLKAEIFGAKAGQKLLQGTPLQAVDFDAPGNQALVMKYLITGLPTTLFLRADGMEIDRIVGYDGKQAFLEEARGILAGRDGLHLLRDQLARNPKDLKLLYKAGYKLLLRGQEREALGYYDRILRLDAGDRTGLASQVMLHRGRYLVRGKHDYGAAAKLLARAVALYGDGRHGEALRYWHGWALCKAGKPAAAAAALDRYVKQKDRAASALTLAAGLRRKCGYHDKEALAMAREAARKKPKDDWAWYLVADLSHALGQPAAAREAIAKAIALDPKSAFYRNEQKRLGKVK